MVSTPRLGARNIVAGAKSNVNLIYKWPDLTNLATVDTTVGRHITNSPKYCTAPTCKCGIAFHRS